MYGRRVAERAAATAHDLNFWLFWARWDRCEGFLRRTDVFLYYPWLLGEGPDDSDVHTSLWAHGHCVPVLHTAATSWAHWSSRCQANWNPFLAADWAQASSSSPSRSRSPRSCCSTSSWSSRRRRRTRRSGWTTRPSTSPSWTQSGTSSTTSWPSAWPAARRSFSAGLPSGTSPRRWAGATNGFQLETELVHAVCGSCEGMGTWAATWRWGGSRLGPEGTGDYGGPSRGLRPEQNASAGFVRRRCISCRSSRSTPSAAVDAVAGRL